MRMVIVFLIGIIIGFVAFAYTPIGNRYEVKSVGSTAIFYKYDKWTGQTYWTTVHKKKVWTLLP